MGWISNAEYLAEETLKSMSGNRPGFTPDRNATGFYRHFIEMNTGNQAWNSEYSTIDSGIFLCGALFAKKYFNNNTTIENYVEQIYNTMDWSKVIADVQQGRLYMIMNANGNGQSNASLPPFNEYMIVAWLAMKAEQNNPGDATQLWNLHFEHADSLLTKTYQGIPVLTDSPNSYIPSFTLQFPYYMCHHFTTQTDYLQYFEQARRADSLWFATVTNYNSYEWGLGAGSYNTGSGYHADEINDNPSQIVSPHIIAGFIPIYPQAEQDLIDLYNNNKGKFTLPNSSAPNQILWRYSNTVPSWSASEVQGIDYSTMLFGLASLPQFLGKDFFAYYNDYDFPPYSTSTITIESNHNLTIYPNPVQDELNLKIEGVYQGKLQLRILDIEGKLLQILEVMKNESTTHYLIPFQEWTSGVYFVEVLGDDGQRLVKKVVK